MDRLPTLIALTSLAAVLSCDGDAPPPAKSGGRVDAVVAKPPKVDLDGFCDVHPSADAAAKFAWPTLAAEAPKATAGWRWINVWATWCRPCVEELPMLAGLRSSIAADHLPLELTFLSVDGEAELVAKFAKDHPGTPEGLRIRDAATLPQWLTSIGLDENSALPIHLFVDDQQRIRCVRMGEVEARHYETVRGLVRGG